MTTTFDCTSRDASKVALPDPLKDDGQPHETTPTVLPALAPCHALAVTGPWSTLATPTAPISGLIEYVDTNPPAGSAFYRTWQP